MRRVVEYPFRRRTTVRQRRISAREKVNIIKTQAIRAADCLPSLKPILLKSFSFHKCLLLKKLLTPFTFSVCTFLAIHQNGLDKNAQSRRISVSSPYNRTAETDFGERKSEYNKNQREAFRLPFLNFELISAKSLVFNRPLSLLKIHTPSLFRSALF